MTYGVAAPRDFSPFNRGRFTRKAYSHTVSGAGALAFSMVIGAWLFYARPVDGSHGDHRPTVEPATVFVPREPASTDVASETDNSSDSVGASADSAAVAGTSAPNSSADGNTTSASGFVDSDNYIALLDPGYSLGSVPVPLARSMPLSSHFAAATQETAEAVVKPIMVLPPERPALPDTVANVPIPPASELVENVPLPPLRPVTLAAPGESRAQARAAARHPAQLAKATAPVEEPADHRSFFDKLFGSQQPSTPGLAYASAEEGAIDNRRGIATASPGLYTRSTAIYDIAAHTVYLPNGTRLEAHSGLGGWLDDPRHVNEKMRGATPPAFYDLQPREQLFHGVRALRLIPVGNENVYGRTGLLAHTFMLGPNGQSNGCVSFRNYNAFLQAYESGEIKRLVVVARLN
jgi:hypothetical protein